MNQAFDSTYHRYPSARNPVFAKNGMVNTSTPQASAAGIEILKMGGNAIDAAVAAASTLTVTEPTANGLGSDAFALIWSAEDQKLYGLNASGPAPKLASLDNYRRDGKLVNGKMPKRGWGAVTVPGAVGAWAAAAKRFGKLPMTKSLAPAIRYAKDGYPVGAGLYTSWKQDYEQYLEELKGEEFREWFRTFHPLCRAWEPGEIVKLPDHAKTLREIAETQGESFYRGAIAQRIDADSKAHGGYLRAEDLAAFHPEWVEPLKVDYHGYQVCEIPPNGQGIVALMALNILSNFEFAEKECCETFHRQFEAMKIAFADGLHYVTDPKEMSIEAKRLLDPAYGRKRAAEIGDTAKLYSWDTPPGSGTVYLCCADGEGNMVSWIQSNYMGFGSCIVVKDTGIALQNRGADFSTDQDHANVIAPGKKTYHTIIPGFLMKDGRPVGPFCVMGAYMQPQGHVQVVMNYIDFHLNPQQCLDAPRWQWIRGKRFITETSFSDEIARQLKAKGHDINTELETALFGKGQMIVRLPNGVLCGGTESRYDSNIAAY